MGSNKVASIALFDVSILMNTPTGNGETYFKRSVNCLKKMILRKIFAQDNDEMAVILCGSNETNNTLARNEMYHNISVLSNLCLPSWKLHEKVDLLETSTLSKSDWIHGLIVALDFLKSETQGKRFREKQLVIFSNFDVETEATMETIRPVIDILEGEKIKFVVIGIDLEEYIEADSQISSSLGLIFKVVDILGDLGITYSYEEVESELVYFEKKRKMKRLNRITLMIGSDIELPVRWMKVTNEETRFKWELVMPENPEKSGKTTWNCKPAGESSDYKVEYVTDMKKTTNFGDTLVDLSYADIEAMKRQTGPPSFTLLGTVKRKRVPRHMFVGRDLYAILPDKDPRGHSMFVALVDSLLKLDRYALARRVAVKNGKVVIGALLPVCDESGKAMYFLKLPFAEWVQTLPPVKPLPPPNNEAARNAILNLIKSSILPDDLAEGGKGLLLRDPTFQSRCHALSLRATGKLPEAVSFTPSAPSVDHILNPCPLSEGAKDALRRLATIFPPEVTNQQDAPPVGKPEAVNIDDENIKKEREEIERLLNAMSENDALEDSFSPELF